VANIQAYKASIVVLEILQAEIASGTHLICDSPTRVTLQLLDYVRVPRHNLLCPNLLALRLVVLRRLLRRCIIDLREIDRPGISGSVAGRPKITWLGERKD
jgi:hypothetical protein